MSEHMTVRQAEVEGDDVQIRYDRADRAERPDDQTRRPADCHASDRDGRNGVREDRRHGRFARFYQTVGVQGPAAGLASSAPGHGGIVIPSTVSARSPIARN